MRNNSKRIVTVIALYMYQHEGVWYYWYVMDYMGLVSVGPLWTAPVYPQGPAFTGQKYNYTALSNLGYEYEFESHIWHNPGISIIDKLYYDRPGIKDLYPKVVTNSHHLLNSLEQDTDYIRKYTVHTLKATEFVTNGKTICHFYDISKAKFKDVKDVYNTGFITEDQAANIVKELWKGTKYQDEINKSGSIVNANNINNLYFGSGWVNKRIYNAYNNDLDYPLYREVYSLSRVTETGLIHIGETEIPRRHLRFESYTHAQELSVPDNILEKVDQGKVLIIAYTITANALQGGSTEYRVIPGVLYFPKPRYIPVPPQTYHSVIRIEMNYNNYVYSLFYTIGYHYRHTRESMLDNYIPSPLSALKKNKIKKLKITVILRPTPNVTGYPAYKTYTNSHEIEISRFKPVIQIKGEMKNGNYTYDIITDEVSYYKQSDPIKLASGVLSGITPLSHYLICDIETMA